MKKLELYYPLDRVLILQHFGESPEYYQKEFGIKYHNGLDMVDTGYRGINGAAIYAAHDGVVLYTSTDRNEGLGVVIRTLEPYEYKGQPAFFKTISWHMEDIKVSTDQQVTIGQLIGHVDNTGKSNGPHLHFGLKPGTLFNGMYWKNLEPDNGVLGAIDPLPYLLFPSANQLKKNLSLLQLVIQKLSLSVAEFVKGRQQVKPLGNSMNDNRRFGAFSSSTDPEKLGNTVRSVILALSTTLLLLTSWFGFTLTDNQITEFAVQAGYGASSLWFFYGLLQKAVVRFAEKK